LSWPAAFAILFIAIPPLLFHWYPTSFWANTDYEPLGLGDALNMAYRLADFRIYPAVGMADHPGVPFYFMSWLALAFAGYPVASKGPSFFNAVIEHVEEFHQISIWLGALIGGAGVYIFARTARNLVPLGVPALGLLLWVTSTPATLLMFTTPSIESFAMLVNGLFFYALVRVAHDGDVRRSVTVLAAGVSAFAYLNKLPYINVSLALSAAGILNLVFRGAGRELIIRRAVLFTLTSLGIILAAGCLVIGWDEFLHLLRFHKGVVFNSGMYGSGDQFVVSATDLRHAMDAIPRNKAFAMIIAPIAGGLLVVGGLLAPRRGIEHIPVAVISIGAGLASLLAAVFVFKHYDIHYTAGVSATLPASAVASYLLVKSWGYRPRIVAASLAMVAVLFMASDMTVLLISIMQNSVRASRLAAADLPEIYAQQAKDKRPVAFLYKVPFAWYGEGFVIYNASVPRLKDEYIESRREMFSASAAGLADRQVGAYVIDKRYFSTAESVRASPNLTLLESKPVTFEPGDRLIELRTSFLLIRNSGSEINCRSPEGPIVRKFDPGPRSISCRN
jgi:hypothetical protein